MDAPELDVHPALVHFQSGERIAGARAVVDRPEGGDLRLRIFVEKARKPVLRYEAVVESLEVSRSRRQPSVVNLGGVMFKGEVVEIKRGQGCGCSSVLSKGRFTPSTWVSE